MSIICRQYPSLAFKAWSWHQAAWIQTLDLSKFGQLPTLPYSHRRNIVKFQNVCKLSTVLGVSNKFNIQTVLLVLPLATEFRFSKIFEILFLFLYSSVSHWSLKAICSLNLKKKKPGNCLLRNLAYLLAILRLLDYCKYPTIQREVTECQPLDGTWNLGSEPN